MIYEKDWQIMVPTCTGGDALLLFDDIFSIEEIMWWWLLYERMSSRYKPKDIYSNTKIPLRDISFEALDPNIAHFIGILKEEWLTEIIKTYNNTDVILNSAHHTNKVYHKVKYTPYLWFVRHFMDRELKDEFIWSIMRQKNYYIISWKDFIYFMLELLQAWYKFNHSFEWYKILKKKTGNKKIDEFIRVMVEIIEWKSKPNIYYNRCLEEWFFANVEKVFNWYIASGYDSDLLIKQASEYSSEYPFTLL